MEHIFIAVFSMFVLFYAFFQFSPRPILDPKRPDTKVLATKTASELEDWLVNHEAQNPHIVNGAEACIKWAAEPKVTELCFLYIHGFSATRQEIAPVTELIADHFNANAVYARLSGHGVTQDSMNATAEDWLQSVVDSWEIASRIGKKVVLIATSTGAPLSIWLNEQIELKNQLHAMIFLSPNFKIKNPLGFMLTWPWAQYWIPYIFGKERKWEPENELAAKYWTHRYATKAVIEMQKVVDWASNLKQSSAHPALATFYMKNDPTINHRAAVNFHKKWQSDYKVLHPVDTNNETPQHVFVGDIAAPQRNEWCVKASIKFLESLSVDGIQVSDPLN
jgi:esterase/lipase